MDWTGCEFVESIPTIMGGIPVVTGSCVPAEFIEIGEQLGETAEDLAFNFKLDPDMVETVLSFVRKHAPANCSQMQAQPIDHDFIDWTGCSTVERRPGVLGGKPVVVGSRVTAHAVWSSYLLGESPAEIAYSFTLPLHQVFAILAYASEREPVASVA